MNTTTVTNFQCFTKEQVKEINKKIKKNIFQKEESPNAANYTSKKGNFFPFPCPPLIELLHLWLYHCQETNRGVFGYDIYWDFHLDFFNYNVYGTGGEYDWHLDATTSSVYDMKLTCLLNLSEEPYEGGDFYVLSADEKIPFNSGEGLILNSLITHKVTPVTKGERITLTYWATGPSWR